MPTLHTTTFADFSTHSSPLSSDYFVGHYADGSAEFKTTYHDLVRSLNHDTDLAYTHDFSTHAIKPVDGENTASGNYSVVSGGINNVAGTQYSAVVAGNNNVACSTAAGPHASAFVGGGHDNCACGDWNPVVVGGSYNCATGSNSFVGGGCGNRAEGYHSTIAGGTNNCIDGDGGSNATIGGGLYNSASGDYSVVSGGRNNRLRDGSSFATIAGGCSNIIHVNNNASTISGGCCNEICHYSDNSTIGGGRFNYAEDSCTTISGGYGNTASNGYSTISGGYYNIADGYVSTIGGGDCNRALGWASTIAGGNCNIACCSSTTIDGGHCNNALGFNSKVGGGSHNVAHGQSAIVGGGYRNISALPKQIDIYTSTDSTNGTYYLGFGPGPGVWYHKNSDDSYIYGDGSRWSLYDNTLHTETLYNNKGLFEDGWYGEAGTNFYGASNSYQTETTVVAGGERNQAIGCGDVVSGGYNNVTYSGYYGVPWSVPSVIGGGWFNYNASALSTIGGGENNASCSAYGSTIGGGRSNCIGAGWSPTIGGGQDNCVSGGSSTVAGGKYNCVGGYLNYDGPDSGYYKCVRGGTIAGGGYNWIGGNWSTIAGGCHNKISGDESSIGINSTVSGGYNNHIRYTNNAVIGGGCDNTIHNSHHNSSILGGYNNHVCHNNSHIIGSNISTCQSNATFVENIVSSGVVKSAAGAPNGSTGFTFNGDGGSDTGLFSYNYVDGCGNDGWVSLYSNDQEVIQASNAAVNYIRIKDTTNGHTYNLQVTNGAPVLTQVS